MDNKNQVSDKEKVCIIIPSKNSAKTLERCLKSIIQQTYRAIELIVVDNHSTDGTREIAERYSARLIQTGVGRAKAKNLACNAAKREYVLFIDSDMEFTKNVVTECVQSCLDEPYAITIPERSIGSGFWVKVRDF